MNPEPMNTMNLPSFAFVGRSRAGGERDLVADFRGDDGSTITVTIGPCEDGQVQFSFDRSGVSETCFSQGELGKVISVSLSLFAALRSGSKVQRGAA